MVKLGDVLANRKVWSSYLPQVIRNVYSEGLSVLSGSRVPLTLGDEWKWVQWHSGQWVYIGEYGSVEDGQFQPDEQLAFLLLDLIYDYDSEYKSISEIIDILGEPEWNELLSDLYRKYPQYGEILDFIASTVSKMNFVEEKEEPYVPVPRFKDDFVWVI